ncbi:hypothetical protein LUZ61_015724 [Rhynchospora tenuis]|uniref:Uncharacterized protein n=1 Tax=Rhynchospora tenuis TaxID=198213 RepID=A0AAD5Z455_9POAL|nr:hypothetical protein LUZ61_015724 [Rhynchospora tenuis]
MGANLKTLLYSIPSMAAENGGFYNGTAGEDPDQVYGLIMCYEDASPTDCSACLQAVASSGIQICQNSKTAVVFYDLCLLHYSNSNYFSLAETSTSPFCLYNGNYASNRTSFNSSLIEVTNSLRAKAPYVVDMYANGSSSDKMVYGLMQCTKDLTPKECDRCLSNAIHNSSGCFNGKLDLGLRSMGVSCYVRYESSPFSVYGSKNGLIVSPTTATSSEYPGLQSPPTNSSSSGGSHSNSIIIAVASVCAFLVLLGVALCFWRRKRRQMNIANSRYPLENVKSSQELISRKELQVFNLRTLRVATNNFSRENFLGEGGFGAVYKGILQSGEEIAVKKLKEGSRQGILEFETEVRSLAALKHKNLVQLIGYCKDGNVQLLCYEYLPKGSLDKILFERCNDDRQVLSWEERLKIAQGICCGLRYVHEESTNGIVHRDLKSANILLDKHMNPKLSDFGTAKFFKDEQTHKFTMHPIWTLGYVAPEYQQYGKYSFKSDVYSFGVMLLEIVTGQKSYPPGPNSPSLIGNVIKKWMDGTIDELKDSEMGSASIEEIKRCIQIGLCCVHENAANRPKISEIDLMLQGYLDVPPVSEEWLNSWMNFYYTTTESYSLS